MSLADHATADDQEDEMDGDRPAFYWCLDHDRVEASEDRCRADNRLGPYDSPEAARNWRATVEDRNEAWDEQDEQWEGRSAD